jgi:hypothetical protein
MDNKHGFCHASHLPKHLTLNVDDSLITITYNFPENNDTAMDTHASIAVFAVVDDKRFELSTSAMRTQRSPS